MAESRRSSRSINSDRRATGHRRRSLLRRGLLIESGRSCDLPCNSLLQGRLLRSSGGRNEHSLRSRAQPLAPGPRARGVGGPGEEITLETQDGLGGQLTRASTRADVAGIDLRIPHPLSAPLFVEVAEPGDVLAVDLIGYESADFGTTPIIPGFGFLADLFTEPYLVRWDTAGGVARSPELPEVAIPGDPFAGVVGVAPSSELLDALR